MSNMHQRAEVARKIREQLEILGGRKSASQVAREIGYEGDRLIYAFACGELRVPLDRAVPLAKALEIEPGAFFAAVLSAFMPLPNGLKISFGALKASDENEIEKQLEDLRTATEIIVKGEDDVPVIQATGRQSIVDLNFKVTSDFHRRFKGEAAARGISMKELLEASFQACLSG
jgi:hypothetical protein